MSAVASPNNLTSGARASGNDGLARTPVQRYARAAGVLLLLTMVCGGFGELYVQSKLIVPGDAAATASRFVANDALFRLGFASYLIEAMCDIVLAWIFYVLLRPVRRNLALLAAFFGLVSTAVFAVNELFFFGVSFVLGGAPYLNTFSPAQLHSLAYLLFTFYGYGGGLFFVFYGAATIIRGYLILRSNFLPKFLGVLLLLAGSCFVVKNFLLVLAPAYDTDLLLTPMFLTIISLTGWFLVKGVDVERWHASAALSLTSSGT